MRSARGTRLVGTLVAIAVPAGILAAVAGTLESQATPVGFDGIPAGIVAQMTGGVVCPIGRTMDEQPPLVEASAFRFGFVLPCVSDGEGGTLASYPSANDAPMTYASAGGPVAGGPDDALDLGARDADTVTFYFQADRATPRTDDFVLMRQVSGRRPEAVRRNLLAYPGRPFFQYYYRKADNGRRITQAVPASWLPLKHAAAVHGTAADTGIVARIDTLRAVEINYSLTNGRTGESERIQPVSTVVPLSMLGTGKKTHPCNDESLFSQASMGRRAACSAADW